MLRSVFALTLIAFAFVACKKNKTEDPPIDKQQHSITLSGVWRILIDNRWGPSAFSFNHLDSTYQKMSLEVITEEGPFHTKAFNNPDSLELHLINDTLILIKQGNGHLKVTAGDSTRLYRKVNWPG